MSAAVRAMTLEETLEMFAVMEQLDGVGGRREEAQPAKVEPERFYGLRLASDLTEIYENYWARKVKEAREEVYGR